MKQKVFVEEQRKRFQDIKNYRAALSDVLQTLRDELTERLQMDNSGWQEILTVPEAAASQLEIETKG